MNFPEDFIKEYDKENYLEDIKKIPEHLRKGASLGENLVFEKKFSNIVILGMGGSFISGFLVKKFLKAANIEVSHDYDIPSFVDENSLVICVSYSGNTEETISAFRQAIRKKSTIIGLSTGGKIEDLCRLSGNQLVKLPSSGLQPRASIGYQFSALLGILEKAGVIKGVKAALANTAKALAKDVFSELAVELSEKLYRKIPVIYSSELFYPVAYRWKTQFNENSKILAISNSFSEQNHNEILGFANAAKQGQFHIVMLNSDDDSPKIKKRMKLTKEMARKKEIDVTEIAIMGNDHLTRLVSAILIGDYTSYYLALRYKCDPSDIEAIEWLKKEI